MTLIFDLEANGLLDTITRVHTLVIHDYEAGVTHRFRHNDVEDNIRDGLEMLRTHPLIGGHNVIGYDIPALKKIYPDWEPEGEVFDTLVLVRIAAPDIKGQDFVRWRKQLLPSNLIGSHSLEAWGWRLGKHKGDYSKDMKAKGLDPWAAWNQEMEDYCVGDVEVTTILYKNILAQNIHPDCVALEHDIHTIAVKMEENGFPFDYEGAQALFETLSSQYESLRAEVVAKIGKRFRSTKKKRIKPQFYDPEGLARKKELDGKFPKPDIANGEDLSRTWWGEVKVYKRPQFRNSFDYAAEAPFCPAVWTDINPTSRDQVLEFLVDDLGYIPTEFTETGAPSVDAAALEVLAKKHPIAKDIGELFFYQKLLGQLATGTKAWMKYYNPATGCIHGRTNTGGAVTGRCTHAHPNIAQVPSVVVDDSKKDANGKKIKRILLGREGEYGWECRALFRMLPDWKQVGVDLSGIEFRCLAHLTAPFDGGELVQVVLTGDIHSFNMQKTGIPDRAIIKRVLYGLLYGAGDYKLGITAKPTASDAEATALGASLRAQLMAGLPALHEAIKRVQREAKRGFLIGLDGRRIKVRSEHSALNTRLQSDAALIAKRWVVRTDQAARELGAFHGWKDTYGVLGDYAMLAFVHDELQSAVAPGFAEHYAHLAVESARLAGEDFEFRCPVGAEAKIGMSWAECH